MILSFIRSCISSYGWLSNMWFTRCSILIDLTLTMDACLSSWMANCWATYTMKNLALSSTFWPSNGRLWLITHLHIHTVGLFTHYTLVMSSTYSFLDRTELIVCIMCSTIRLEHIWCTWSFTFTLTISPYLVWAPIHNNWWLFFKELFKVKSLSSDTLLCFNLCVI